MSQIRFWLRKILPPVPMRFLVFPLVILIPLRFMVTRFLNSSMTHTREMHERLTRSGLLTEADIAETARQMAFLQCMFLVPLLIAAWGYGLYRLGSFHPAVDEKYRNWLRMSPWQPGRRLPLAPAVLDHRDALLLLLFCLIASPVPGTALVMGIIGLFAGCLLGAIYLAVRMKHWWWLYPLFAAGSVIPSATLRGLVPGLIVAVAGYALTVVYVRWSLRDFPWPQMKDAVALSEQRRSVPGWPWLLRASDRNTVDLPRAHALPLGVAVVWAIFVIGDCVAVFARLTDRPVSHDADVAWLLTTAGVAFLVIGSLGTYLPLVMPSSGPLGRMGARRWVIPDYDRVLLVPVLAPLAAFGVCRVMEPLPVSPAVTIGLILGLLTFAFLAFSPSLQAWRLTAPGRLNSNLSAQRKDVEEL